MACFCSSFLFRTHVDISLQDVDLLFSIGLLLCTSYIQGQVKNEGKRKGRLGRRGGFLLLPFSRPTDCKTTHIAQVSLGWDYPDMWRHFGGIQEVPISKDDFRNFSGAVWVHFLLWLFIFQALHWDLPHICESMVAACPVLATREEKKKFTKQIFLSIPHIKCATQLSNGNLS